MNSFGQFSRPSFKNISSVIWVFITGFQTIQILCSEKQQFTKLCLLTINLLYPVSLIFPRQIIWICDHFSYRNVGWEGKTTSWSILQTCITLKTIADYIWVPKILITGMGKIPIAGGNIWTRARTAGLSWRISIVTIDASVKANSFY